MIPKKVCALAPRLHFLMPSTGRIANVTNPADELTSGVDVMG